MTSRQRGRWIGEEHLHAAGEHLCEYVEYDCDSCATITILPGGHQASFRFLNASRLLEIEAIPWTHADWDQLWLYHLNYFDYLPVLAIQYRKRRNPVLVQTARALMENWIASNAPGTECSWDPYPMSLRIRNWIWAYRLFGSGLREPSFWNRVADSIYEQTDLLARNLEFDLGANHLLENCLGMLVAGHCFAGRRAEKWRTRALSLLRRELGRQMLADGGHYERSPMYHGIVLQHILETAALLPRASEGFELLRDASCKMLRFLSAVVCRDGEIPLFGDSAFGLAPHPSTLARYAGALFGASNVPPPAMESPSVYELGVRELEGSGIYKLLSPIFEATFNGKSILSHTQPGHAHCDLFSYELLLKGERVIVDTGVFTYYGDLDVRTYSRSTRAHNTTMVDGREQLEIWGRFRVGRRPRVLAAGACMSDEMPSFYGRYVGCRGAGRGLHIHRWARLIAGSILLVLDRVENKGDHVAESFVHFHPHVRRENNAFAFHSSAGPLRIVPMDGVSVDITSGSYFPEFGKKQENLVAHLFRAGSGPLLIGYLVGATPDEDSFLRAHSSHPDEVIVSVGTESWSGDIHLPVPSGYVHRLP